MVRLDNVVYVWFPMTKLMSEEEDNEVYITEAEPKYGSFCFRCLGLDFSGRP